MAVLAGPRAVFNPAMQHQYEGTGASMRATPTAIAKGAVLASAPHPTPADIMGDPMEAPRASIHFWTTMGAVQAQGASTGFEVCLLACLLIFR